eukprot:TRINITY_DN5449_c1_g1_i7.p1 TRINITY_DN5449_c1_g1~~TRINITY_DN5449_c1_g1_i7.p1  ORF type:complete len:350 (-),score=125.67 TRINITY_DN5449_c1_g1_i7:49-1098(-)
MAVAAPVDAPISQTLVQEHVAAATADERVIPIPPPRRVVTVRASKWGMAPSFAAPSAPSEPTTAVTKEEAPALVKMNAASDLPVPSANTAPYALSASASSTSDAALFDVASPFDTVSPFDVVPPSPSPPSLEEKLATSSSSAYEATVLEPASHVNYEEMERLSIAKSEQQHIQQHEQHDMTIASEATPASLDCKEACTLERDQEAASVIIAPVPVLYPAPILQDQQQQMAYPYVASLDKPDFGPSSMMMPTMASMAESRQQQREEKKVQKHMKVQAKIKERLRKRSEVYSYACPDYFGIQAHDVSLPMNQTLPAGLTYSTGTAQSQQVMIKNPPPHTTGHAYSTGAAHM